MENLVGKVVYRWPVLTLYRVEAQWDGCARLAKLSELANGEQRIYPSHQLTVVEDVDQFKRKHRIYEYGKEARRDNHPRTSAILAGKKVPAPSLG